MFANVTLVQFPSSECSYFLSVAKVIGSSGDHDGSQLFSPEDKKNNNNKNNNSAHALNFSADIPERGPQARCCNPENQRTAAPVHFFHNPKR